MSGIRVLVVDDSIIVRRVVTEELSVQPDLEVVATVSNGKAALERLVELDPDLVILDIEMPEMDGLTALKWMRQARPRTPVIMFSSQTTDGAAATLEALAGGAADFFAKPTGPGGLEAARRVLRENLVPAIRALCPRKGAAEPARQPARTGLSAPEPEPQAVSGGPRVLNPRVELLLPQRLDILVIGASTGGPNALVEVFSALTGKFPVPILVVQHMPPLFTQMLAERLTRVSAITTVEAQSGMILEPGVAYVAPGDYHLVLTREGERTVTRVEQSSPENGCRPSLDPLLRSVARIYGRNSLAVILTGMGQDGLNGCVAIHEAQGSIVVQDQATSVVWGMPGHVARAGLAGQVLPLSAIAGEINRQMRFGRG